MFNGDSQLYVVIFEVKPNESGKETYLDLAVQLRKESSKVDGSISIERFRSLNNHHKILSLSTWRDEDSIRVWRDQHDHQSTQKEGRGLLFAGYRIRVAQVVRDYCLETSPWQK